MIFREAKMEDITQIQFVRNSVKENTLSDPSLITDEQCKAYIFERGKGWVCVINSRIVGFAIVDLQENNVWALFTHPEFEEKGIGRKLHQLMLDWYFSNTKTTLWLGTAFNTRAEKFYKKAGWIENGLHGTKEIKFEMSFEHWNSKDESR